MKYIHITTTKILFCLCAFYSHIQANTGTITLHNGTSNAINIQGRKQIGQNRPQFKAFEESITIAPNSSINLGSFSFLLDLNIRKASEKKCYIVQPIPTFETQQGHIGDDLLINVSSKKSGWLSWSEDKFITTYNWSRSTQDATKINKLNRPYWHDITQLKQQFIKDKQESKYIRRTFYYNKNNNSLTKQELLDTPRHVLFSIHGTFARQSKEFYDPQDKMFENILAYAESLGDSVEIVSLEWTGKNESNARVAAGQFLAWLINEYYLDENRYLDLNTISHSHGGNAVNVATHFIERPFETIVSLYTPIRTDFIWFTPQINKFKTLYHFYSTSDVIQFLGSVNVYALNLLNAFGDWGARKALVNTHNSQENNGKIYNIRVEFRGISPAHVNKQAIVQYLPQLIWYINNTYKINYDLDADIDPSNKEILVAIRHSISPTIINSETATPAMKEQAQKESAASRNSQSKYIIKYQKEMGQKGWRAINLLRSGKQTIFGS